MKSWIPGVVGLGILIIFIGIVYGIEKPEKADTALEVRDFGVFLTGIGLLIGALIDTEEDKFVRFGMLLAAAIIIGLLWGSLISYGYS